VTSRVPDLSRPLTAGLAGLLVVALALVAAGPVAPPPAPADDVHAPATAPLDPRIAPDRITEQDPPPLPEQVILPLPPDHRIAAGPDEVPIDAAHWTMARDAIRTGLAALRREQDASGQWMSDAEAATTDDPDAPSPVSVAVTAFAVKGFAQLGDDDDAATTAANAETVRRALRGIRAARNADGGYTDGPLANYVTAAVVSALSSVDEFAHADAIRAGSAWLVRGQWDQSEGLSPRQDWFGGAGYGNRGRPDLSNTQLMLEALYDAGHSPSEPAFQRALAFVSRTQNLSRTNAAEWAGDDGGFVYTPANGGESMASEAAGEGRRGELVADGVPRSLRSYGSMTYAGFKSMLYAGLSPDDVRVRAAYDWIRRHLTFEENPGLGDQGLYYYYHAMSRALRVAQQDVITDERGAPHNWREELIEAVVRRQRADGLWRNDAERWLEGEAVMATVHAVLALEETLKPVSGAGAGRPEVDDAPAAAAPAAGLRITVTYAEALADAYSGRVYVLMSTGSRREPRFGPRWFGDDPFFAVDVDGWRPDAPLVLAGNDVHTFPRPMDGVPAGTWSVQAVMRLNPDSPRIGTGAGNAYSDVWRGEIDVTKPSPVALRIDRRVVSRPFPESDRIKLFEMRSDRMTEFLGRPAVLRAAVILPVGYDDDPERRYPVQYVIGGFGSDHRMALRFRGMWDRAGFQDRLARVVLDPLCFGGHHVFADSASNGPRGTALVEELIPALEQAYRFDPIPAARFVGGHSSGGWSSLWLQVAHPDFFGGVWSTAPDPVDFSHFQTVDIYASDANMYVSADGGRVPVARRGDTPFAYTRDFCAMEDVYGEGGQLRSFEWVFSPRSADGHPRRLWDRATGAVDPDVAEAWKAYDIRLVLEENWERLGPRLAGKLNVFCGDADTFYLDGAVARLKEAMERLGADAVVEIHAGRDHGSLLSAELIERMDREMVEAYERATR
jgi:S-formylglutathione hydrolase FrmB